MPVVPPERNDALSSDPFPRWTLIGPGLAATIGLFLLTALFFGTEGLAPVQVELDLSGQELLLNGVVAYLVAAAIGFPLGVLLGARFLPAVTMSAIGVVVMLVGVLLVAFVGSAGMLLVGRVLTGFGTGAALGATTALVRKIGHRRTVVAAAVAALGVLAAIVAPFVNQVISSALGFRWTFLAAVPLLCLAFLASAVSGIALLVRARRPAVQPRPPGMPYPPPQ